MRFEFLCLAAPVALAAHAAHAGDTVHYGAAPGWVENLDAKLDPKATDPLILFDVQQRVEDGTLTSYVDQALLLNSPQALTVAGTSNAVWLPDKGDLTINKVQIIREGTTIDVLAGDTKYTVLRRENNLERRTLDGTLTATMAVPGLRMGDILRVAYTVTFKDPTLAGNVQLTNPLLAKPIAIGFGQERISWPADTALHWKAGPAVDGVKEVTKDGYHTLTVAMPLPKRDDMPDDAPARFSRPPILQATTFGGWDQVSRLFAPLYATDHAIADKSPLAAEADRIAAASKDPVRRAALATQLVQDKISYLMNGMSTGNYVPASPAETWKTRYGDCKAKTLLLLAILHRLGIAAEAVLVNSQISDATPDLLPMPGAFDHVLVRADIAGMSYWLDGTSSGTRMANIADTPNFRYGLPLRTAGTGLMHIAPRVPEMPGLSADMQLDQRGGVDLPTLVKVDVNFSGAMASQLGAAIKQASAQQVKDMKDRFARSIVDNLSVTSNEMTFDEATGTARAEFTGIVTSDWKDDGARKRMVIDELPSANLSFQPNRARASWKDIPVELGYPDRGKMTLRILLPEGESGYRIEGKQDLDVGFAGKHILRKATVGEHQIVFTETVDSLGGELAPADIAAERLKASRLTNDNPSVVSPADATRLWQYARPEFKQRIAPYEAAYAKAIAREEEDKDKARSYLNRANFRSGVLNFTGAIADYSQAIALEPDADTYRQRGSAYYMAGDLDKAVADFREAYGLEPSAGTALSLASALGEAGKTDEALALIDQYDTSGDQHIAAVQTRADVLAWGGRKEEGLADLSKLIADQPGQGALLNASCWYRARFKVGTDGMIGLCNDAVERAGMAAATLDSRALAWIQMGDMEKAQADAKSALALRPTMFQTRYLLAVAEKSLGDKSAADYIAYFQKTWPGMARQYADYGVKP